MSQNSNLTQTQDKHKQTSMPRVELEPTTPVFEREKTIHAVDRAATGIVITRHANPLNVAVLLYYNYF
jgi:hypothetical protein